MNPSEAELSSIMRETSCTRQTALKAYEKANGNLKDAKIIAKDLKKMDYYAGGASSGICVESHRRKMTKYKNGVLIEDKFYDYSDPKNLELKAMLAQNEFDAEILGGSPGDQIEIDVLDLEDEEYREKHQVQKPFQSEGRKLGQGAVFPDLPTELKIADNCDAKFKMIAGAKKILVLGNGNMKICDFLQYLRHTFKFEKDLVIEKNGKKVDVNDTLSSISQCLVNLEQQ